MNKMRSKTSLDIVSLKVRMRLSERQQLGVSLTPANLTYTGPQTVFQYTIIGQQLCLATSASQEYITLKAGPTRYRIE
jgi:hypothetical protein